MGAQYFKCLHQFGPSVTSLLFGMLHRDLALRSDIRSVMDHPYLQPDFWTSTHFKGAEDWDRFIKSSSIIAKMINDQASAFDEDEAFLNFNTPMFHHTVSNIINLLRFENEQRFKISKKLLKKGERSRSQKYRREPCCKFVDDTFIGSSNLEKFVSHSLATNVTTHSMGLI